MKIIQWPNAILFVALAAWALSHIAVLQTPARAISMVAFIAWAYDELRYGDSWFRRGLGGVVLVCMIIATMKLIA